MKSITPKKRKIRKGKETGGIEIFVISGPGGVGKTTLLQRLFHKKTIRDKFLRGISFTTRHSRPQEKEGEDYFFVSKKEFLILRRGGFFLESQKVLDDYYGTPKYFYRRALKERKRLLLCIDIKGGMYLKKIFKPATIITVFISAPQKELLQRLKERIEAKETIKKRLRLAKEEQLEAKKYDCVVINREIAVTLKALEKILLAKSKSMGGRNER